MKKFIIYYFFFLLFFNSLFVSGVIDSEDGFLYLAVARNIYYNHEPTAPLYEYTGGVWVGKNIHMNTHIGKDNKTYSKTGIGYSLAMVPAVALTDLVYKYYQIPPPVHFPLESDWLLLFLASFTNMFFSALLGVVLFLYLLRLKLTPTPALFISLISIFTTNLFVFTKHSYAHMMFSSFLLLSFYLLKRFSQTQKYQYLLFSGLSYGVVILSYNPTFALPVIPYILYYLLLTKPKLNLISLKAHLKQLFLLFISIFPFLVVYYWLEEMRSPAVISNISATIYQGKTFASNVPFRIYFEGIYGQLFSPGRSFFIYSPVILLIPLFWHKIKRYLVPEIVVLISISVIYLIFLSTQRVSEGGDQIIGYWHGELSWGPRYLVPLIPFALLIVGAIYKTLTLKAKFVIFYPLLLIGFFIQITGVLIPYQTKLHNLEQDVYISGYHYTSFTYMNFIPQFSPILTGSKKLQNLIKNFPKTLDHGPYNTRFFDGIDFPFNVGLERWRTIEGQGYILFDNNYKKPVEKISLTLINHPLKESTSSAQVNFFLNQQEVDTLPNILILGKRTDIEIVIPTPLLKEKDNLLLIDAAFTDPSIRSIYKDNNKQLIALLGFYINGQPTNLESLDFPYISALGPKTNNITYKNYGGLQNNPWQPWMIRTQIFERTPDLWWIKPLYFWDLPKSFFISLFLLVVAGVIFFGRKTIQSLKLTHSLN